MKLALVQMEISERTTEKNMQKIERFIVQAALQNVDIIVFPEDCVAGPAAKKRELYDFNQVNKKFFQKLAKENSIDIVTGSWIESNSNGRYNTCYYIDANGKALARYRKINLWRSEKPHVTAGNKPIVFQTKHCKAGLAVCWDLTDPLLFRKMAKKGAQIIYCPSFWSSAGISNFEIEKNNINALCHARALENELAIVYVNAAGKRAKNDELIGHSQVVVPIKGAIARLNHNKEKMIITELDLDILKRANSVYKIRNQIKSQLL